MNALLAASLFDSPWIIVAFVVFSMLANWLSKRRQEKDAAGADPSPSSSKSPGDFDLEETLRRLMGEEPPTPTAPPPIPQPVRREMPARAVQREKAESRQPVRQSKPTLGLPPLTVTQSALAVAVVGEQQREAVRRFEDSSQQGRRSTEVTGRGRGRSLTAERQVSSAWRDPRKARRAFVASLVFAPPKGLEP